MKYERYPDELTHYGVLGMKWGIRKARKAGKPYHYSSFATKSYRKAAEKNLKKGDIKKYKYANSMAKASQDLDNNALNIVNRMTKGQLIVAALLPTMADVAISSKAAGYTKKQSIGAAAISAFDITGTMALDIRDKYIKENSKKYGRPKDM